jgi:hypothetical protein
MATMRTAAVEVGAIVEATVEAGATTEVAVVAMEEATAVATAEATAEDAATASLSMLAPLPARGPRASAAMTPITWR